LAKGKKGSIHIKKSEEGSFRAITKTPKGKDIPMKKIKQEEKSKDPAVRKKAQFAENARHFNHKKKGK
jgi:hypothetical protein